MKWLVFLLMLVVAASVCGQGASMFTVIDTLALTPTVTQTVRVDVSTALDSGVYIDTIGDSAAEYVSPNQVMRIEVAAEKDSFDYVCQFAFASTSTLTASFLSPLYSLKITPTVAMPSHTYVDTIFLAADTFIVEWTSPATGVTVAMVCDSLLKAINDSTTITDSVTASDGTTHYLVTSNFSSTNLSRYTIRTDIFQTVTTNFATSTAWLVDTLVYRINHVTNLKDSVVAADSGSYVKVTDKFSEETHGGKWTLVLSAELDSGSTVATKASIVDGILAVIAESDSLSSFATFIDMDTFYYVAGNRPGDTPHVAIGDTVQDTTLTTADVLADSYDDTLSLGNCVLWTGVKGQIILAASAYTTGGFGTTDTSVLVLKTRIPGTTVYAEIDSSFSGGLPDTLTFDAVGKDSLFLQEAILIIHWGDAVPIPPGDTASAVITVRGKKWY